MTTYIIISLISGILFGIMDGLINGNPLAARLYKPFQPITKTSINVVAGIMIDLVYGFLLAGLYWFMYPVLPGSANILRGICFGVIVWFLRVVMSVVSQWMMFKIPFKTLGYTLLAGLAEMLVLGILYGLTLPPALVIH